MGSNFTMCAHCGGRSGDKTDGSISHAVGCPESGMVAGVIVPAPGGAGETKSLDLSDVGPLEVRHDWLSPFQKGVLVNLAYQELCYRAETNVLVDWDDVWLMLQVVLRRGKMSVAPADQEDIAGMVYEAVLNER